MAKGAILNLTFPEASTILDQVAKQAHAWDNKWRDVSYESSNFTTSQDRDEAIAQLSTQMTLLTKLIAEMMAQKVHVVESSSGQLQEQYNHVQDQEEDANYVSNYQGGPNEQRTNYQGGQDDDQWRPLQQWNSNQGWNNQQNNQGWSANSQGNRGADSSQAYNASRDPMYQQGNQSPPYHNQGQQFSLSEDNYEQAKEATDFLVNNN
ncbi:hypothetical protein R3W88_005039 [Solanum pinnatisectum]|uniref:Uncharacterized protein n=1 Tax=Solanum pinnatisectum TaxID=50273 RepID=A0AAV9KBF8_9SOLN|nr:hypothetical protein R3W88_005039 [Solanum pinnatisectum]